MTTYRVVEYPPYDKGAPNTFWIKEEIKWLGFIIKSQTLGDFKMDSTYGELGQMPFFSKKAAKKRLRTLKQ